MSAVRHQGDRPLKECLGSLHHASEPIPIGIFGSYCSISRLADYQPDSVLDRAGVGSDIAIDLENRDGAISGEVRTGLSGSTTSGK